MMISSYTVPESNAQFRQRGGRFGSPSANESMRRCITLVFLEMPAMKRGDCGAGRKVSVMH
jgi:hypothetical protein